MLVGAWSRMRRAPSPCVSDGGPLVGAPFRFDQAPRNSRKLAVRNQFFTPRYVVQFFTDNTLGRLWLEMHGDKTRLTTLCEYLVRSGDDTALSRPRKDPRDLRILDPACG
jgi:hypothetical protein